MQQVLDIAAQHWPLIAVLLPCVIEIVPVKWSPLTSLFTWLGKILTAGVMAELKDVKAELAEVKRTQAEQQATIDDNEMDRIRFEVLDFANSCRNGRKHTQDEFEHVIVLNTKYHRLLEKTDDENGVFDAEYVYILELYHRCQRENTFL